MSSASTETHVESAVTRLPDSPSRARAEVPGLAPAPFNTAIADSAVGALVEALEAETDRRDAIPAQPLSPLPGPGDLAALNGSRPRSADGSPTPSLGVGSHYHALASPYVVSVHYLRASIDSSLLRGARDVLEPLFGPPEEIRGGYLGYSDTLDFKGVASIFYFRDASDLDPRTRRFTVQIEGDGCDRLEPADLRHLLITLRSFECSCSRLDLALDDCSGLMDVNRLIKYAQMGHFTGFQRTEWTVGGVPTGTVDARRRPLVVYDRKQVSFGRRGSKGGGKLLRVYDKALESNADFPWLRYEVEFSRDLARSAFHRLYESCHNVSAFENTIGQLVTGTITFVHRRHGDHHVGRAKIYRFWQRMLDAGGGPGIVLRRPRRGVKSVEKVKASIRRIAGPALAALKIYCDGQAKAGKCQPDAFDHFIADTVAGGEHRLNRNHAEFLDRAAPGWRERITGGTDVSADVPATPSSTPGNQEPPYAAATDAPQRRSLAPQEV